MNVPLRALGPILLGLVAGASFVTQQAVNARLRGSLASAPWAAFFSYLGGTLVMLVVAVLTRSGVPPLRGPWWAWTGGVFGAVYVVSLIVLLPRLGAAVAVATVVVGQMLASTALDAGAWLDVPRHPLTATRVVGALLLLAGVVLMRR